MPTDPSRALVVAGAQEDPTARPYYGRPMALQFDLRTRRHVLGSNGVFASVHPVDERMTLLAGIRRGRLGSSPETGNTVHEVTMVDGAYTEADVRDRLMTAFRPLVEAGDVTIDDIAVDVEPHGRLLWAVEYTNLRTGQPGKV